MLLSLGRRRLLFNFQLTSRSIFNSLSTGSQHLFPTSHYQVINSILNCCSTSSQHAQSAASQQASSRFPRPEQGTTKGQTLSAGFVSSLTRSTGQTTRQDRELVISARFVIFLTGFLARPTLSRFFHPMAQLFVTGSPLFALACTSLHQSCLTNLHQHQCIASPLHMTAKEERGNVLIAWHNLVYNQDLPPLQNIMVFNSLYHTTFLPHS